MAKSKSQDLDGFPAVRDRGRITYVFLEPSVRHHGGYAHAQGIIRNLIALGWQLDFLAPQYRSAGLPRSFAVRAVKLLGCIGRFALQAFRSDLVYLRYHPVSIVPAVLARMRGLPIVLEINGPWDDVFVNWPKLKLFAALLHRSFHLQVKMADAVIAVTPQLTVAANAIAAGRAVNITNGADGDVFRPGIRRPKDIALPDRYVSFCSFLSRWQGVSTVVAATREPSWPAGLPIVIAGDGPDRKEISSAAEAMPERIKYLGLRTEAEVASVLANSMAAIVAVTNLRGRADTGLAPIKLFEAMATGIPVIVTDFPYQREIVRESQCGVVVQASDPAALAEGVAQIIHNTDEANRMGAAGRQAVLQTFSWRTAAEKTSAVLESVVAARRARTGRG